jgi:hypothetical protein
LTDRSCEHSSCHKPRYGRFGARINRLFHAKKYLKNRISTKPFFATCPCSGDSVKLGVVGNCTTCTDRDWIKIYHPLRISTKPASQILDMIWLLSG